MQRPRVIRVDFQPDRIWPDRLRQTYEIVVPVVLRERRTGAREAAVERRLPGRAAKGRRVA
jgi:hypothetical protein